MAASHEDWLDVQERLIAGDRLAFLQLTRLVTGVLTQLRAYDFEQEWDDLRQEVAMAVIANARKGRLRDPRAFVGYVRIITRNKFVDRLKKRMKQREHEVLPWDEETARALEGRAVLAAAPEEDGELWGEVERLPEEERKLVLGVYREGKTYQEMSDESGIPLGTLKRRLRQALGVLRGRLGESAGGG
jgi:RNA polymerase sigma-70 factor (ECF subfamily)